VLISKFLILIFMLQFSNLTIEAAVANQGGAMEADTISKNGRSSKSQMSRGNFLLIIISLMTIIMFSMVTCGGSGSGNKIPNGTYFIEEGMSSRDVFFIFSGNKFTLEGSTGGWMCNNGCKGTYEIFRTGDGKDRIIFTLENAIVRNYSYSRVENKIRIDDILFIKGKSSNRGGIDGKRIQLNGTYVGYDGEFGLNYDVIYTGNRWRQEHPVAGVSEGTYELVEKSNRKGVSKGIFYRTTSQWGTREMNYVLEGNKFKYEVAEDWWFEYTKK